MIGVYPTRVTTRRLILALLIIVLLAGCASRDNQPKLFTLDNTPSRATTVELPPDNAPTLVVEPVSLASYLKRGGIVYQTARHRVAIADHNRWASPLSEALTQRLANTLDARLPAVHVVRSPETAESASTRVLHLTTHVSQFIGHYKGDARIAGRWQLKDASGDRHAKEQFNRRLPLKTSGYPALVASLSKGWRRITRAVAQDLHTRIRTKEQTQADS